MSSNERPVDLLRRAAALIEEIREDQRVHDAADPWSSPHVRAVLHPWVALMAPTLAEPLSAWLRAEAEHLNAMAIEPTGEATAFARALLGENQA